MELSQEQDVGPGSSEDTILISARLRQALALAAAAPAFARAAPRALRCRRPSRAGGCYARRGGSFKVVLLGG